MAVWEYKAVDAKGKDVEGTLEAGTKEEVNSMLLKKRMKVTKIKKKAKEISLKIGTGIAPKDIARFTRQFSAMTSAGLPLLQCLTILQDQTENPFMADVVKKLAQKIQGGSSLADALALHPKVFGELYVNMVAAGEAGGILDEILMRLAEYQESAEKLKRKIKGAMTYPVIIVIVAFTVIFVLMTFVVPTFAKMFSDAGGELPMPTLIVMGISDFFQDYFYLIIGGVVGFVVFIKQWGKTASGRLILDTMKMKAPIIGNLEQKGSIARFSRTLGTLLNSGVSIIDALQVTGKTSGNKLLEQGIMKTLESITGGNTIAEPLQATGLFPPMVVQMIGVGEKTGGMPEMLEKIADFYDDEVDAAVETLTAAIEPLIIVFLGGVVGGILVAMYMPMFSMADTVK